MVHLPKILDALARSLSYPDEHTVQAAELLYVMLQGELPEAASAASAFGVYLEPREQYELEEAYSRTFDINPACALEVGWHLFGEEYARGLFLVRLRGEMRLRGLEESAELPDHITHVLAILAAMPADEAQRFVHACVRPALEKMLAKLVEVDSPYRHVIGCLALVLDSEFGRLEPADDEPAQDAAVAGDLLRDFPMPCDPGETVEIVPLRASFHDSPATSAPVEIPLSAGAGGHANAIPDMLRDRVRHGETHG